MSSNYVQKATGASPSGLTDSVVYDNGSGAGIATTSVFAPVTVWNTSGASPSQKTAQGAWFQLGPVSGAGDQNNPAAGDSVTVYVTAETFSSKTSIWGINGVTTNYPNGGSGQPARGTIIGIEWDTQNCYTLDGTSPPEPWVQFSSVGIGSVLHGSAGADGSAAFSAHVNLNGGSNKWKYSYHAWGGRTAAYYSKHVHSDGSTVFNPTYDFWSDTNSSSAIRISGSPGLSIDSTNIHVYVGGTSPALGSAAQGLTVTEGGLVQILSASDGLLTFCYSGGNGTNTAMAFYRGVSPPVLQGSVTTTGGTASYNSASDARLKTNVEDLQDATQILSRLRPVTFEFLAYPGVARMGFIAQEVLEVVPEAVTEITGGLSGGETFLPLQLDTGKLIPVIVGAMQDVIARLTALETGAVA
jgi:Chaperone of endosialidase